MIFGSVTGWNPVAVSSTGCAEPMTVNGAIAAKSVDSKRIVPALQAFAPAGPTHPMIGIRVARNMRWISCVSASPPPGVSRRTMSARASCAWAAAIAAFMYSTVARVISPSMCATRTGSFCPRTDGTITANATRANKAMRERRIVTAPDSGPS